jgi:hypothetical protein
MMKGIKEKSWWWQFGALCSRFFFLLLGFSSGESSVFPDGPVKSLFLQPLVLQ